MKETIEIMSCTECGAVIDCEEYFNDDGNSICEGCFSEYYYYCDNCGDVTSWDDCISIDGGREYVCQDCAECYYYRCDDCGEYVSLRRLWANRNMAICYSCNDNYYICEDCGDIISCDDIHYIDGEYYCDDCAPSHRSAIRDYRYKPTPIFYGELSDTRKGYYGLELEIDDGDDKQEAARCIQDAGGDCIYLKHDGSLSCDGFEIVTHPATLKYHMTLFPWHNICQAALDYDYRSHDTDTCGLHIHASITLFGADRTTQDLNIAKVILLVDCWWEQYIVPFSRRNYNQLNDWAKKPNALILPTDTEHEAMAKAKQSSEYDRYKAVNLKNYHTVEFRFFRGTLRRDTIIASIQFIDTLINYVSGVKLKDLWDKTFNDVFSGTQYAELKDYLQKRKLLDESEEI